MQLIKMMQKLFIIFFIGASGPLLAASAAVVNSTADTDGTFPYTTAETSVGSGIITLRSAIRFSQGASSVAPTTITFNIPTSDPGFQPAGADSWWLIQPQLVMGQGAAFLINGVGKQVIIDGYQTGVTFPASVNNNFFASGSNAVLRIEIRGTGIGNGTTAPARAFLIDSVSGCTFQGLCINNYLGDVPTETFGQCIVTNDNTTISGCFLGTNILGDTATDVFIPIEIDGGTSTIGGNTPANSNVIAGSLSTFGCITFFGGTGHTVQRNYIGTDKTGQLALGRTSQGICIGDDSVNNCTIDTNLVSGCSGMAIQIRGIVNLITNNLVGTDATGTRVIGNTLGIALFASNNTNSNVVQNNTVSGSSASGIQVSPDLGSTFSLNSNQINGNKIGLDTTGTIVLGNGRAGIIIENAINTTIQQKNLISGNTENGIFVGSRSAGTIIEANIIGSSINGAQAFDSNGRSFGNGIGIQINCSDDNNII